MGENLYFIEQTCPLCGPAGQLAFYLCDDRSTVIVMCEECHGIWTRPGEITNNNSHGANPPDWRIKDLDCGIGEGSRWATREEIEEAGFADLIAGESEPL